MLIACPQCNATYDVPRERVPPGREVRCARCITLWTPVPLEPVLVQQVATATLDVQPDIMPELHQEPALSPVLETVPPPVSMADPGSATAEPGSATAEPGLGIAERGSAIAEVPDAAAPPPVRRDWRLAVAWTLTFAGLAGLGWLAVTQRAAVMQAWPPSERAYIAIGLAPRH